ncbi:Menaquinone reductase [bacterium HR36]|nr:Menaquinone reductase [bacterium HR36]
MTGVWDAVVIGLGPAGAVAAWRLAVLGCRVLAVDRAEFPRDKVCGGCISHPGLTWLRRMGLVGELRGLALPLRGAEVRAGALRLTVALPTGLVIARRDLDYALVQKASAAGAKVITRCPAWVGECQGNSRKVWLQSGPGASQTVRASVVVLADGLAGTASRYVAELRRRSLGSQRFGAACCLPDGSAWAPGWVYLAYGAGEYLGVTRLADGRLQVAGAWRYRVGQGIPLTQRAERLLQRCGLPIPLGLTKAVWKGTPLFGVVRPAAAERLLVVGDARGYFEPFTGQGIALALESGWRLGEWLVQHGGWSPALAHDWQRFTARLLTHRQFWTRCISWLLDHTRLAQWTLRCLSHWPTLAHRWIWHWYGSSKPSLPHPSSGDPSALASSMFVGE